MTFTDQMGRLVPLSVFPPRRIVSLVPSQTELLHYLGLETETVGITKFCVHPEAWFREKSKIGGTKTLNFEKIAALRPDLVIGNKEENEQSQIETLEKTLPVWMSDVKNLDDALVMIRCIGQLTGKNIEAEKLTKEIDLEFSRWATSETIVNRKSPKVAYFIWRKPWMVAAGDTYINSMLGRAGFCNVFAGLSRYPEISLTDLVEVQPDSLFLSSEPYPFREKHFDALREACPAAKVMLVDGEMFSWYGNRLLSAPSYFQRLRVELGL